VLRERSELPANGTITATVDDFETKLAAIAPRIGGEL